MISFGKPTRHLTDEMLPEFVDIAFCERKSQLNTTYIPAGKTVVAPSASLDSPTPANMIRALSTRRGYRSISLVGSFLSSSVSG